MDPSYTRKRILCLHASCRNNLQYLKIFLCVQVSFVVDSESLCRCIQNNLHLFRLPWKYASRNITRFHFLADIGCAHLSYFIILNKNFDDKPPTFAIRFPFLTETRFHFNTRNIWNCMYCTSIP